MRNYFLQFTVVERLCFVVLVAQHYCLIFLQLPPSDLKVKGTIYDCIQQF